MYDEEIKESKTKEETGMTLDDVKAKGFKTTRDGIAKAIVAFRSQKEESADWDWDRDHLKKQAEEHTEKQINLLLQRDLVDLLVWVYKNTHYKTPTVLYDELGLKKGDKHSLIWRFIICHAFYDNTCRDVDQEVGEIEKSRKEKENQLDKEIDAGAVLSKLSKIVSTDGEDT